MIYLCSITDSMWYRYSTRVKCKSSNLTKCFYYSFFFSAFLPFLPPSLHPFFLSFSKSLSSSCKSQVNPQKMVLFSCSAVSNSLQPYGLQHTRPPCPSPTPGVYSTHVHWVGDAIQASHPLSSPSPPAFSLSQHQSYTVLNASQMFICWILTWSPRSTFHYTWENWSKTCFK